MYINNFYMVVKEGSQTLLQEVSLRHEEGSDLIQILHKTISGIIFMNEYLLFFSGARAKTGEPKLWFS